MPNLEQMLINAYLSGVNWAGNSTIKEIFEFGNKAARDYADKTLSTLTDHPETQPNAFVVVVHPMDSIHKPAYPTEIYTHENAVSVILNLEGQRLGWIDAHETFKDYKG